MGYASWRSLADHKNLTYYFETALTPNVFWVDIRQVDFSVGQPVRKLRLAEHQVYAGDVLAQSKPAQPFVFAGL